VSIEGHRTAVTAITAVTSIDSDGTHLPINVNVYATPSLRKTAVLKEGQILGIDMHTADSVVGKNG